MIYFSKLNCIVNLLFSALSFYYNPAGLSYIQGKQIYISDVEWLSDLRLLNMAYAQNLGKGGLAVNILYYGLPSFQEYDSNGNALESNLTKADYAVGLGYGLPVLIKNLHSGISIKYFYCKLVNQTSKGISGDIGLNFNFVLTRLGDKVNDNNCSLAMVFKNFGYNIFGFNKKESLPMTGIFGLSYSFFKMKKHDVLFAGQIKQILDSTLIPSLGMEYCYYEKLFLRAGYMFNHDMQNITYGIGLKHRARDAYYINFDFAYAPTTYEENLITLSVGIQYIPEKDRNEVYKQIINEKQREWDVESRKK